MKIILFDGVCNFCNTTVNFMLKHDREHVFRFSPLQSEKGREILRQQGRLDTNLNALIFIEEDQLMEGMDAVMAISKYLKGCFRLIYLLRFLPHRVTHTAYALIAKNRYRWFGKKEVCRIPKPGEEDRFL